VSYDLMIWEGKHPATEQEALELLERYTDEYLGETMLEPYPPIVEFANRLGLVWTDNPDDTDSSASPWSTYPLLSDASGPFMQVSVQWNRAEEVAPIVARTARDLGLACVDGNGLIYSETSGVSPSIAKVRSAMPSLFPEPSPEQPEPPGKNGGFFSRFRRKQN
jgi:hypothetical protein